MTPATIAAPASTTSGTVICHGDSWGWNSRRSRTASGRSSSEIPSRSSPPASAASTTPASADRAASTSARAVSIDAVTSSTDSWALTAPSWALSRFLVAFSTAFSSDWSTSASSACRCSSFSVALSSFSWAYDALFGGADTGVGLGHSSLRSGDPVVPDLGDLLGADVGVAVLAEEGHEDLPAHVERREQRREQTDDPQHRVDVVGVGQDFVFRPEAETAARRRLRASRR